MRERIAVVGAGAAGAITATWLTGRGYDVVLCDRKEQCREDFGVIGRLGIEVDGPGLTSGCRPAKLTYDIADAMEADRVLVCVSAGRQEGVAEWMRPHIRADHKILLIPGNLGTVVFHRVFRETGVSCELLAELAECPWACRRLEPGRYVSAMPLGLRRIAAFPAEDIPAALACFGDLFPLEAGANLIENCLNSPNVLTHLPGTLLNLGGIAQKREQFALFTDGFSDGYTRCVEIMEAERNDVLEAVGMVCYAPPVGPLLAMLREKEIHPELAAFRRLAGPDGLEHRYISEDAACGVALFVSLARKYKVNAPVTEALLTLAGRLAGKDYLRSGRTWEWLGNEAADIC